MVGKTISHYRTLKELGEGMPFVDVSPEFEPLHSTPGIQAILRRMNLPQ